MLDNLDKSDKPDDIDGSVDDQGGPDMLNYQNGLDYLENPIDPNGSDDLNELGRLEDPHRLGRTDNSNRLDGPNNHGGLSEPDDPDGLKGPTT